MIIRSKGLRIPRPKGRGGEKMIGEKPLVPLFGGEFAKTGFGLLISKKK